MMGQFIEAFFHGVQEWSQRTASSDEDIRLMIMVDLGKYDEGQDTEYNLDLVEKRVEEVVEDMHISERFLIVALIREIEHVFETHLQDAEQGEYSRGVRRIREAKERIFAKATDQERQSPSFQERFRRFEELERSLFPTPEKIAMRKLFLCVWREVMAPLLRSENVEG